MRASVVLLCLLLVAGGQPVGAAEELELSAEPQRGATPVGVIFAHDQLWSCDGRSCLARSARAELSVAACRLLAEQVGRLGYFGHRDRSQVLGAADLAKCNDGIGDSTFAVIVPAAAQTPRGLVAVAAQTAAAPDGELKLGNTTWTCSKGQCTTQAVTIDAADCRALVEKIGPLAGVFMPGGKELLGPTELAACNAAAGATAAASGGGTAAPTGASQSSLGNTAIGVATRRAVTDARLRHLETVTALRQARLRLRQQSQPPPATGESPSGGRGGEDCNDNRQNIHPMAPEVCDNIDNNCDGNIDDGVLGRYFLDADGDLHGDPTRIVMMCPQDAAASGYSGTANDCDDADPHRWIRDPSDPSRCEGAVAPFPDQASPLPEAPQ